MFYEATSRADSSFIATCSSQDTAEVTCILSLQAHVLPGKDASSSANSILSTA